MVVEEKMEEEMVLVTEAFQVVTELLLLLIMEHLPLLLRLIMELPHLPATGLHHLQIMVLQMEVRYNLIND